MDKRTSKSKSTKSKSSIPTPSTKSSSKSKLPKESKRHEEPKKTSKKPKEEPKTVTPEPPAPVDEYEDDFEEYESDFEDDVSQVKPTSMGKDSPKSAASSPTESKHLEEEVVQSEDEEIRKESFILNRINQTKHPNASSSSLAPTSIIRSTNELRPATSANRVFRFDNRAAPNTEDLMQSAKVFAQLRSEGSLTKNFIQSVDVAPNRMSEIFNSLIENSTSSQRFTQTGEDSLDNNSQTTPRDHLDKANQFPAIFVTTESNQSSRPHKKFDSFSTAERFLKFVGISERTFLSLMSSNSESESVHLALRPNVEFSAGFAQFTLDQIAKKYETIGMEISHDSAPKILVGFYITESDQRSLVDKSILMEYNFSDMEQPINTYLTGDKITDFAYSSDGKSLIFAGQRSGNCLLWDLLNRRQANENAPQIELNTKTTPQLPAYSTAHVYVERKKRAFTHQPDQSVIRTKALKSNDSNGQQQFLSLHAGANATIWAVTRDQFIGGNTDDLGLDFMSLVRLMKISTNVCSTIVGFGSAAQVALSLDVSPSNSTEFIVGMSNGAVVRVCRSRQNEHQIRRYNLASGPTSDQSSANSVCFCPHNSNYFAAGSSTGSLLVFKTDRSNPLMEVQLKENRSYRVNQLTDLSWSHSHGQILYALYDSKYLAIWDLSSQMEPEILDLTQKFSSTVTRMFACDAINHTSYISFTLTSGSILIHELHRVSAQPIEVGKLFNSFAN